jgi:hypothetical protein
MDLNDCHPFPLDFSKLLSELETMLFTWKYCDQVERAHVKRLTQLEGHGRCPILKDRTTLF